MLNRRYKANSLDDARGSCNAGYFWINKELYSSVSKDSLVICMANFLQIYIRAIFDQHTKP